LAKQVSKNYFQGKNMNPNKKTIGCLVPTCDNPNCDREFKKICALRKFFLKEIQERKERFALIKFLLDPKELKEWHSSVYFWRIK